MKKARAILVLGKPNRRDIHKLHRLTRRTIQKTIRNEMARADDRPMLGYHNMAR